MFRDRFSQLIQDTNAKPGDIRKATGIPISQIYRYKSGERRPSGENLRKLADFFGVSVDYLLGRESASAEAEAEDGTRKRIMDILAGLDPELLELAAAQLEALSALQERRDKPEGSDDPAHRGAP